VPVASAFDGSAVSYRVWLSRWLYERQIDDAAWVAFVPHRPGLPVVVDEVTHALLHACDQGADSEEVVRQIRHRYPSATQDAAIRGLTAACSALGFLTDEPEPPRFRATQDTPHAIPELSVWLYLTSGCNLSCSYCFVEQTGRNMSAATLERAVDAIVSTAVARGAGTVDARLGGGEPTMVLPAAERAHDLLARRLAAAGIALKTRMVTNGTRVDDRLLAFLTRSGIGVGVSLDGYGPAHDVHRRFKHTGRGSWTLVSGNIEKLLAAGADVRIAATLSEDSCSSLPDLIRWTIPRSLPVHLQFVSEPKRPWSTDTPSPDDYRTFNDRLIAAVGEAFLVLEHHLEHAGAVPDLSFDQVSVDQPQFSRCCGIGSNCLAVTEDGKVSPCPTLARTQRAPLADDLVAAAAALLPGSPARRNDRDDDPCLACQWFPCCTGGCPAMNERVNGDEVSTSPLCAFRRVAIPRLVDYLGRRLLSQARREGVAAFRFLHVPMQWANEPAAANGDSTIG